MLFAAFQPSSILTGREVGKWELQECLWGLDSGITCPETEAIKSLACFGLFLQDVAVFGVYGLQHSGKWGWINGCSLQPVLLLLPTAPNLPQVCPRCAVLPAGSSGLCLLAALAGNICLGVWDLEEHSSA